MPSHVSSGFLCFAYAGISSASSNSYALSRFPQAEERANARFGLADRFRAFLSVDCLRAPDPSPVRRCPTPPRGIVGVCGEYMEIIYRGHFSAVEFLWRPGPLSARHETVPSFFPARGRPRIAPSRVKPLATSGRPQGDVRVSATRRSAWRDRPDPGRAPRPCGCRHPDPSGLRHRINAAVHLRNRASRNGSAPTMSTREISMLRFPDDLSFANGGA